MLVASVAMASVLGACAPAAPGPGHARAIADELDPSGRPYTGPAVVATSPPGDNGAPRLACHPEGIGTRCERTP